MTFSQRLLRAELSALAALLILVVIGTVIVGAAALLSERNPVVPTAQDALSFVVTGAISAFLLGTVLVAAFGAPIYAVLDARGQAHWGSIVVLGAVPGLIVLLLNTAFVQGTVGTDLSVPFIVSICGIIVSSLTHVLYRRRRTRASGV